MRRPPCAALYPRAMTLTEATLPPMREAPHRDLCTDCGISRSSEPKRCSRACQFIAPAFATEGRRAVDRHHHAHRRTAARGRCRRCSVDHAPRRSRCVEARARARDPRRRHGRLPRHAHGLCAAAGAARAGHRARLQAARGDRHPMPGVCLARARTGARLRAALRHRHALLRHHHDREIPRLPRPRRRAAERGAFAPSPTSSSAPTTEWSCASPTAARS